MTGAGAGRSALVGVTATLALVAAGCSSSDPIEKSGDAATTSPSTTRATSTTGEGAPSSSDTNDTTDNPDSADSAGFAALEAKLITTVPDGFTAQPDDVGDTGPSDLDKAVHDDGSPDARSVLRSNGFVRGYQRLWADEAGDRQIIVFLYEFGSAEGASAYGARMSEGLRSEPGVSDTFALDGVPGSAGIVGASDGNAAAALMFTSGVHVAQIVVNGPAGDAADGYVQAAKLLATDQFARLQG